MSGWTPRECRRLVDDLQQDDHCKMTFAGENWRIIYMAGLGFICLHGIDDRTRWMTLDLSEADLDTYCDNAADWLANDPR